MDAPLECLFALLRAQLDELVKGFDIASRLKMLARTAHDDAADRLIAFRIDNGLEQLLSHIDGQSVARLRSVESYGCNCAVLFIQKIVCHLFVSLILFYFSDMSENQATARCAAPRRRNFQMPSVSFSRSSRPSPIR